MNEFVSSLGQLLHYQRMCADHLINDERAAVLCSKFAGVAGHLLDRKLSRLDLIRWREEGLEGARRAKLLEDQVGHLTYLSFAHFSNNNSAKALELLDEARKLTQQLEDPRGSATVLQHQGMFYGQLGKVEDAITALTESLRVFEQLGAPQLNSKSLSALATCYSNKDDAEKAVELYEQAVELERDRSTIGTYLTNMSGDLMKLGRFPEALQCLRKAEVISRATSDDTLSGLVAMQFGQWHSMQRDLKLRDKTWAYYEKALNFFLRKGDRYYERKVSERLVLLYSQALNSYSENWNYDQVSYALRKLIPLYMNLDKFEEAMQACDSLFEEAELNENNSDQLEALVSLGHTLLQMKLYGRAIEKHIKAIEVMKKIRRMDGEESNLKAEAELQLSLGQAFRHSGQPEKAIQCYDRAEEISKQLRNKDIEYRAIGNQGLVCADQSRFARAIGLLTDAFTYYKEINDQRLAGHAKFNLAYVYHRSGEPEKAQEIGADALRTLTIINDSQIEEVKRQLKSW